MRNEKNYSSPELSSREKVILNITSGARIIRPHRTLMGIFVHESYMRWELGGPIDYPEEYSPQNVVLAIDDKKKWVAIDFSPGRLYEKPIIAKKEARRLDKILQEFLKRDFLLTSLGHGKNNLYAFDGDKEIPKVLSERLRDPSYIRDAYPYTGALSSECVEKVSSFEMKDLHTWRNGVGYAPSSESILEIKSETK